MGLVPMGLVKTKFTEKHIGSELASEFVSRGVRHRIRQHFQNAVECSAELFGRQILRPIRSQFAFQ